MYARDREGNRLDVILITAALDELQVFAFVFLLTNSSLPPARSKQAASGQTATVRIARAMSARNSGFAMRLRTKYTASCWRWARHRRCITGHSESDYLACVAMINSAMIAARKRTAPHCPLLVATRAALESIRMPTGAP